MPEYQLKARQVVDYPRCRICRQFIQTLMANRSIRTDGGSGLYHYTALCGYANFRTSYRRIEGIRYTVFPGEWVCTPKELSGRFRAQLQKQAIAILDTLRERGPIDYALLCRGKVVKYHILDWKRHNTVLDYNCPCQKDIGFFFLPVPTAMELVSSRRKLSSQKWPESLCRKAFPAFAAGRPSLSYILCTTARKKLIGVVVI